MEHEKFWSFSILYSWSKALTILINFRGCGSAIICKKMLLSYRGGLQRERKMVLEVFVTLVFSRFRRNCVLGTSCFVLCWRLSSRVRILRTASYCPRVIQKYRRIRRKIYSIVQKNINMCEMSAWAFAICLKFTGSFVSVSLIHAHEFRLILRRARCCWTLPRRNSQLTLSALGYFSLRFDPAPD